MATLPRPAHLSANAEPRWLAALERLISTASAMRDAVLELEAATPDYLQHTTPQLVRHNGSHGHAENTSRSEQFPSPARAIRASEAHGDPDAQSRIDGETGAALQQSQARSARAS